MGSLTSGKPPAGTVFPENKIRKVTEENRSVAQMSFPRDIGAHQFVMNFIEYSINGDVASNSMKDSIALPLPGTGIVDKIGVKYNEGELGLIGGAAAGAGAEIGAAVSTLQSGGEVEMPKAIDAAKTFLEGGAAGARGLLKNVEGAGGAADLLIGNVVNPHVVLLFQHVGLKQFNFKWKLAPRGEDESTNLKRIINKLMQHSHPAQKSEGNTSNFFLNYPDQVDLYYAGVNENLHYFKRCAITSMEVDYAPEGNNLLFAKTGAPATVDLSIGFQEIDIWTREDYEEIAERV